MLIGQFVYCDGLPPPKGNSGSQYPTKIFSGRDICRIDTYRSGRPSVLGNPTTILLRSDIILNNKKPFYDEQHTFMDREVCYRILQKYNFGFIYQVLSFMKKHEDQVHAPMDKINSWVAFRFYLLSKYGHSYLAEDEYKKLLDERFKEYCTFLKNHSLRKINFHKEKIFWDYHLKYLNLSGYPISKARIIFYAILECFEIILNPIRFFKIMKKKLFKNT